MVCSMSPVRAGPGEAVGRSRRNWSLAANERERLSHAGNHAVGAHDGNVRIGQHRGPGGRVRAGDEHERARLRVTRYGRKRKLASQKEVPLRWIAEISPTAPSGRPSRPAAEE